MLSVAIARRLTDGRRRELLSHQWNTNLQSADVIVATPRRFVSTRKLIRPNEAIDGMLEVINATHRIAELHGHSCGFAISETPLPRAPLLYLSHHTVDTSFTEELRAKGTTVRHFKAADIPGRTIIDPMGFSGWSSLANATIDSLPLSEINQQDADQSLAAARSRTSSKYAQSDAPSDIGGEYVFVALQTIGDMVQRKAFLPMLDMLDLVVERFAGSGLRIVVKRHPKCRSRVVAKTLQRYSFHPDVTLSTAGIHGLIAGAKAVFTVNSGVGSEAIPFGVPIYCFGASDYAAVAHQVKSTEDLARLTDPIRHKVSPDALSRFHYYYRNIYQIDRATQLDTRLDALITALQ